MLAAFESAALREPQGMGQTSPGTSAEDVGRFHLHSPCTQTAPASSTLGGGILSSQTGGQGLHLQLHCHTGACQGVLCQRARTA